MQHETPPPSEEHGMRSSEKGRKEGSKEEAYFCLGISQEWQALT